MKEQFLALFGGWIDQYKADIQSKVSKFLKENDACPEELAEVIDVPIEDVYNILNGNGERIPVETFGKLLLASGFALAIEPIGNTPLKTYNNVNPHVMREPLHEEGVATRPTPFSRPCMTNEFGMPTHGFGVPPRGFDPNRIPPHVREQFERDMEMEGHITPRHEAPRFTRREVPQSPFDTMSDERLKHIIRHELWDSEINLNTASHRELVNFLIEKDKRKQEILRRDKEEKNHDDLERDPKVAEFVKNMKKNIKENPQFRSYVKNFMNSLDNE